MSYITCPDGAITTWNDDPHFWMLDVRTKRTHVCGAWAVIGSEGGFRLQFCGSHQKVPELPVQRTPGRALRAGRKALNRLKLDIE